MVPFWNFFSPSKKTKRYLFIDIGSGAIRSILIESGPEGLFGFKKQIFNRPMPTERERVVKKTGDQLHEIIFRYIKGLEAFPEKIVIGVSPELTEIAFESITKERKYKKNPVSAREIKEFISEKQSSWNKFPWLYPELINLTIDGYDVPPEGIKNICGSTIKLSLAYPLIKDEFADALSGLQKAWGGLRLEVRSTPLAVTLTIADKLAIDSPKPFTPTAKHQDVREGEGIKDFVTIRIGGSATTIIPVSSGIIQWAESFPIGGNHATLNLAAALNVSITEAEDIKRRFGKFMLPQRISDKAAEVLRTHANKLTETIASLFLNRQNILPPTILLYGGGAKDDRIKEALSSPRWLEKISFSEKANTELVGGELFFEGVLTNSPIKGPEYAGLAALVFQERKTRN